MVEVKYTEDNKEISNQILIDALSAGIKNKLDEEQYKTQKKEVEKKQKLKKRILIGVLAFVSTMVILLASVYVVANKQEYITIKVQDTVMREGEEVPEFHIEVIYEGSGKRIIEKETEYGISGLVEDLMLGNLYALNANEEEYPAGSYPIHLTWDEEEKIMLWDETVHIIVEEGMLLVQDAFGYEKEGLFYDWDDELLGNCWIKYEGENIYINESGEVNIEPLREGMHVYEFDENGVVVSKEIKPDPDLPMIAITVDDGPNDQTKKLVKAMEEYGVHFTFFMLGNRINENTQDILKDVLRLGGEIGNHSFDHPSFVTLTDEEIASQLKKTEDRIFKYTETNSTIMRLPYGAVNDKVAEQVNMPIIAWNVDTEDWKTKSKEKTLEALTTNIKDGDILLGHDIYEWTVDAIIEAIPILLDQGFQLVTVSEMAEARGIELKGGVVYNKLRQVE